MGKRSFGIILIAVMGITDNVARGQTTMPATYPVVIRHWTYPAEPTPARGLEKGALEFSLGGEAITLDTHAHDTLGFLTVGGAYYFTDRVSANLQLLISAGTSGKFTYEDGDLEDASFQLRAIGGLASLRLDLMKIDPIAIYVDAGVGGFGGHRGFLPGRAEEAWLEAAGGGIECRLMADVYLSIGARYVRISDRLLGSSGSRAANGIEYGASLKFRL